MAIIQSLLGDPLTYIVLAALWLGRLYVERRVPRAVDHRFDEKLAHHRHELELITEQARYEYQRRLTSDNLYTSKRHDVAASVYAALRIAHGYVAGLWGIREEFTFEEFNEEDIRGYLTSRQVLRGKQDEILINWGTDRNAALTLLRPYVRMLDVQDADNKFREAKNLVYLNELYLSEAVIPAIDSLVEIMATWLANKRYPSGAARGWRPDREALNAALNRVHEQFRSELAPVVALPPTTGSIAVEKAR